MTMTETFSLETVNKDQITFLKEQFHVFDLNGNGYIEHHELKQGLKRLGYQMSDESLMNLIDLVGSTDQRLNFEQFITWNRELYLQDMRDKFEAIDTDGSGWISRTELIEYYRKTGLDDMTEEDIDDLLYETDFNEDGMMQFNEFLAGMALECIGHAFFVLNGEMFLAKLKHEFVTMDADGDGFVTPDELRMGSTLSASEIELTMKELDTNGDGKISLEEFIASAVSIKQKDTAARQRKVRKIAQKRKKTRPKVSQNQDDVSTATTSPQILLVNPKENQKVKLKPKASKK